MTQRKVWERMWTHMSLSLVPAEKAQKWASWWCAKNNSLYLQESALYTQIIAEISTQTPSQSSHRDYSTDGETEPRWKAPSLKTLSFSMKEGMLRIQARDAHVYLSTHAHACVLVGSPIYMHTEHQAGMTWQSAVPTSFWTTVLPHKTIY